MPPYGKIFLLLWLSSCGFTFAATDFPRCLAEVKSCANGSSNCTLDISSTTALSVLLTSQGHKVNSTNAATALSYTGCTQYCGTGMEQFSWTSFAQDYAAWLLPFLALVSQLPFGAQRRTDNFMSAVLTLGSPTLTGYSLYMTLLNARWVNDRLFAGIDYPDLTVRRSVVRVLSSLQQVPLRIHPGESGIFESLIVHPDNDNWWNTLAEELDFSHGWSIASATSIAWVLVAYIISVAISIAGIYHDETCAQATGSGLLWLLPIVTGWLVLAPKCDYYRVQKAYLKANRHVFVANSDDAVASPSHITSNFGLTISSIPNFPNGRDITSPDEARIPPIFNYARVFSWYRNVYTTSLFYRAAWRKSNDRIGADGVFIPESGHIGLPREGRLGTREQIISYCQPDERNFSGPDVLWPRGLYFNMVVASLMSLQLQWGTTGAAVLALWFTPTVGLGCRSLVHLIYASQSTLVWMLLVLSSALGYYAHHLLEDLDPGKVGQPTSCTFSRNDVQVPVEENHLAIPLSEIRGPSGHPKGESVLTKTTLGAGGIFGLLKCPRMKRIYGQVMSQFAGWLRWIGKSLAIVNAITIITNSVFQYAGLYSNCYCESSMFHTGGAYAFIVINHMPGDIDLAKKAWLGGLGLSLASCSFFVLSIYLVRDSLPS